MAGCCNKFSKWVNYIFGGLVFLLGGLVVGVSVWYLFSEFSDLIETWWVWISLAAGVLLMILSLIGCCAARKQKRCILSCFWVLAVILFIAFLVGAIGSTIFFTLTDNLSKESYGGLNELESLELDAYKLIREGFAEIWRADNCQISCDQDLDSTVTCDPPVCDTDVVEDKMEDWLTEGLTNVNTVDYDGCLVLTEDAAGYEESENAAASWCASNTAVISEVKEWTLGAMVGLWVVAVFTCMLAVANCVLVCSRKNRRYNGPFAQSVNVLKV
ncbi:hypothetical protein FOZ61_008735 [Perkinsus olseni]|uniref:CD151 antigen n=1 Tax=Perkinsus olseni TaxID=32597 RepID=A0A7J6L447_PEROL|nr:hypothetical protein FOZ61_008735 [Perkinsus olseni]KAF4655672.1 hypothetical protein FOL46_008147 [Perkinsus olseni]